MRAPARMSVVGKEPFPRAPLDTRRRSSAATRGERVECRARRDKEPVSHEGPGPDVRRGKGAVPACAPRYAPLKQRRYSG